jgi:hypothetical protein
MTNKFEELCGILTTARSVTLEEMDEAIAQCAVERFNNAVEGFRIGWQEVMRGEYHPVDTLWDDIDK